MGGPRTVEQIGTQLDRYGSEHDRDGFSFWLWRDRESGAVVARGGLRRAAIGTEPVVEVGWTVRPERWGQGIATELGRASVAHGFEALGLPEIWAWTLPDNVASRTVMERLGMSYERDIVHAGLGHVAYRLVNS